MTDGGTEYDTDDASLRTVVLTMLIVLAAFGAIVAIVAPAFVVGDSSPHEGGSGPTDIDSEPATDADEVTDRDGDDADTDEDDGEDGDEDDIDEDDGEDGDAGDDSETDDSDAGESDDTESTDVDDAPDDADDRPDDEAEADEDDPDPAVDQVDGSTDDGRDGSLLEWLGSYLEDLVSGFDED